MPAPEWATATQPVHTTPELPVEVRESLASLATFTSAVPPSQTETSTIYAIKNLALAGTTGGVGSFIEETLSARFQALPFAENVTGLVYVRNRWLDPGTGTFVSPDPLGYRDSSNLYAFAGGDSVNGRDPLGLRSDAKDLPRDFKVPNVPERRNNAAAARSELMIQCGGAALVTRAESAVVGSVAGVAELSTGARMAQHAGRIVNAARDQGAGAAVGAAWGAYTAELQSQVQSLPFIRWGRQIVAVSNADVSGDACAEAQNRVNLAVDVAADAALLLGVIDGMRTPTATTPRPQSAPRAQPSSPLPESYINFDNIVDMRVAPSGSPRTAGGFPRNPNWFWRQMVRDRPQMFDATNQARIRAGSSPLVNAQWVKYNPAHEGFFGETLVHHHINQGPLASPLPESVHRAWTKSLHPYTGK
jgi:RHS repeat-associated protein